MGSIEVQNPVFLCLVHNIFFLLVKVDSADKILWQRESVEFYVLDLFNNISNRSAKHGVKYSLYSSRSSSSKGLGYFPKVDNVAIMFALQVVYLLP